MRGEFAARIEAWYGENRRDLPWRCTRDPYRIWLSEVILQQTRVAQGMEYYLRFVEAYPTVESLADAREEDVLRLWQGLGYYSRARNLLAAARQVAALGAFPRTASGLRRLSGVGDYTAAAVASLAFDEAAAVVDGNVYRVLARVFGVDTPIDTTEGKNTFARLAGELLDRKRPALYNQAIMDFGALRCTPRGARCAGCPLGDLCVAAVAGRVEQLPVKARRTRVATRHLVCLYLLSDGATMLRRRTGAGIWRGLYEPLVLEFAAPAGAAEILGHRDVCGWGAGATFRKVMEGRKHQLTHRTLIADGYLVRTEGRPDVEGGIWVEESRRGDYAVPRLIEMFYETVDAVRR